MATPPFQVEDQLDEDFFDKLVEDDFGDGQSYSTEGVIDVDNAKAFENLSIGDLSKELEGASEGEVQPSKATLASSEAYENYASVAEESTSLVSSNDVGSSSVIGLTESFTNAETAADSTINKSGSGGSSIKVVQWSAFSADLNQQEENAFGSYSDFLSEIVDTDKQHSVSDPSAGLVENSVSDLLTAYSSKGQQHAEAYPDVTQQTTDVQDMYNSQYCENLYPGWRYDPVTGQWHQLEGYGEMETTQGLQSDVGEAAETGKTASLSDLNQASQGVSEYPAHMLFDPQYPGWYYDTVTQEWHSLESYSHARQQFQSGSASYPLTSYTPIEGRSSAGRPSHALVSFGFGGKLIVMKPDHSYGQSSSFGSQDSIGGSLSILSLAEIANKTDVTGFGYGACDYLLHLCQQHFPGPLVGGNVASKELYKWLDERIANCASTSVDLRKGELTRLLLSLLKICCQQYGKLRSPFGVDSASNETGSPESALTKLFASARRNNGRSNEYGAFTHCMQNLPSEAQILTTATEVQDLLVFGRRKEALQCAQEGQLWGPALVLASQLGEQFYFDTVKQMARKQFLAGSPLRTLCLLIARGPADVFSADTSVSPYLPVASIQSQQSTQIHSTGMLDVWEENLAIISANRTEGDELVITYLGDCLWKEKGEIMAAHTCYLVAEANFEPYSNSARLCLVGSDHLKYPRTYANPEAIQWTELYEYSKMLGNSQYILQPFQPYKIIYAFMLAEVGKVSDALRYCQAILRTLKNPGRTPEIERWKFLVSSLEERIRAHQQGGYTASLGPGKFVGKLFTSIDKSISRMIGTPPPIPSTSQNSFQSNEHDSHSVVQKVATSQSTMTISSMMPSASMEPISQWNGDASGYSMHNRSVSEPDFARNPKQVDQPKEPGSEGKASMAGGPSRFGRFGSQLIQKTIGWVARSRSEHQAKLGEENKFYYDEKLKRWVEEGVEPPAEEAALPPPPSTAAFQNGIADYNIHNKSQSQSLPSNGGSESKSPNATEQNSGIPPIPPSSNQFSARSRMSVRSRYVDTFNKGELTPTNLFQSPSVPGTKPMGGAKFFVPTPSVYAEPIVLDHVEESTKEITPQENPSTSVTQEPSFPSLSTSSIQRVPSLNNINLSGNRQREPLLSGNGSLHPGSRAASWSGSYTDMLKNNSKNTEPKMHGEAFAMPPPRDNSSMRPITATQRMNSSGSFGEDLQEVEL